MTFGEHIRDGLTNIGISMQRIAAEVRKRHQEAIALGSIPDDQKLEHLKAELYRRARAGESTVQIAEAIETLLSVQAQAEKHQNTLEAQLDRVVTAMLFLTGTLIAFSFPASWVCGGSQSPICQKSRFFHNVIVRQFQEPPRPSHILPKKLP